MQAKDAIKQTMGLSRHVLNAYFADMTDAELLHRPGPGCNHLAWQLGHLIASECSLIESIQAGSAPELPAGFKEKHGKENATSDNPSDFCTKQEYADLFKLVNDATIKLIDEYPEADLDGPAPESFRSMFPTMGLMFLLVATHPMMHAGQFVPVRRALGKPVVI
ncbi:DinB family protein [bacterium]|nr:DinB family protein [bacterium]